MSENSPALWHEIASPVTVIAWSLDQLQLSSQAGQLTAVRVENLLAPALESVEYLENLIAAARREHRTQHHLQGNFLYSVETPQHILVADAPAVAVEVVRLGEVLDRVVKVISPRVEQLGVKIEVELPPEMAGLTLPHSPTTWQEVLMNLLSNALDALSEVKIEKPRQLTLSIRKFQKFLSITVVDNGSGVSNQLSPGIFDQQLTTKGIHGSGLGLGIVKNIVQAQFHGEISVWSKPDQGTCFEVLIPLPNLKSMSFYDKNDIPCKKQSLEQKTR